MSLEIRQREIYNLGHPINNNRHRHDFISLLISDIHQWRIYNIRACKQQMNRGVNMIEQRSPFLRDVSLFFWRRDMETIEKIVCWA